MELNLTYVDLQTKSKINNEKKTPNLNNLDMTIQTIKPMTIAQQIGVTEFPFVVCNKNKELLYCEDEHGSWTKHIYDNQGRAIYSEDSYGYWEKNSYDANGNRTYWETSTGIYSRCEFNEDGHCIFWENKNGIQFDDRQTTVELTLDEIAEKFGIPVNLLKIKK
jgi:hypothetical protein